jgi:hypothetical protein
VHCGQLEFGIDTDVSGALSQLLDAITPQFSLRLRIWSWCMPVWISNSRTPPVAIGIELLPQHPDLARTIC